MWRKRVAAFSFSPESDTWLSYLRIGLGLQVILYCLAFRGDWQLFFASPADALVSRQLSEAIVAAQSPLIPNLAWLVNAAGHLGSSESATLSGIWFALLAAGVLLIAGLFCRESAIVAWLLHLCAAKSGDLLSYGVDSFMTIGLFYLMLAPLPDRHALDSKRRRPRASDPAVLGLFRRVLQVHLCLIYFFAGLTKALGSGWWNGVNIWRSLTRPPFDLIPPGVLAHLSFLLPALGIAIWAIELAYPILIWPRKTHWLWLNLVCAMHLGIGLAMGMYLFALIMIVLNIAAFGAPGLRQPEPSPTPSRSFRPRIKSLPWSRRLRLP